MNKYIKASLFAGFAAVAFTSCEDLDVENKSRYITAEEKEATLVLNPDMAEAGIAGIAASAKQCMAVYDNHFDFGYASTMIGLDLQGHDMMCGWTGYNWFRYWEGFTSPSPSGTPSGEAWYTIFKQIYAANSVASTISSDVEDSTLQFYRAQALLTRGFDYWVLAQLYQFNYEGNENQMCVPIVTNENAADVEQNGAPRATVQEVYDQILKDLDEAIDLLTKSGLEPDQVMQSKPKRYGSLATAYGQRARVYLTMHKYAEAAADAQAAISHFKGSVLSMADAAHPGFCSIDEPNWMWGIPIDETDRVVTSGIVNWPSHMVTFCANGYVSVGAWKYINNLLYDQIPASDVRKGWFLDENGQSAMLTKTEQAYIDGQDTPVGPYGNVKFAGYQKAVGATTNANDIPLMRIEEMYYIAAEGLAMAGNAAQGAEFLTNFVTTYRNPKYSLKYSTPEDVQDAVYFQRRLEFYGEGLSWFDIMRLDMDVDRIGANWPEQATFRIPSLKECGGDPTVSTKASVRIYCIPQGEINGNKAISASQNNPDHNAPTPSWQ